jgi:Tol biopolymer transport system component
LQEVLVRQIHMGLVLLCLTAAITGSQRSTGFAHRPTAAPQPAYASKIVVYDLARRESRVVHQAEGVWEAPNWSRDGKFLLVNSQGRWFRIPVEGKQRRSR